MYVWEIIAKCKLFLWLINDVPWIVKKPIWANPLTFP